MPNLLHQLWGQVERSEAFQKQTPEQKLNTVGQFNDRVREKFGDGVFGHQGFEQNVTRRFQKLVSPKPPAEKKKPQGFLEFLRKPEVRPQGILNSEFAKTAQHSMEREIGNIAQGALPAAELFESFDTEYENEVENGRPESGGFVAEIVGSLAPTIGGAAVASAAAGPVAGYAAGGAIQGAAARVQGIRDAYFTLLSEGTPVAEARQRAANYGNTSAVIQGATAAIPVTAVASKIAARGGKGLITKAAKALDNLPARAVAATGASRGAARFAVETGTLAAVNGAENALIELADIAQERLRGIDLTDRRGSVVERAALNAVVGAGITGATRVGSKARIGNFDTENLAGKLDSIRKLSQSTANDEATLSALENIDDKFSESIDKDKEIKVTEGLIAAVAHRGPSFEAKVTGEDKGEVLAAAKAYDPLEHPVRTAAEIEIYKRTLEGDRDVKLATITHEASHPFQDTLSNLDQAGLFKLFQQEIKTGSGPLFSEPGFIKDGIDPQVLTSYAEFEAAKTSAEAQRHLERSFREWFAERMMLSQHGWATGRAEDADKTGFSRVAANLRQRAELVGRSLGFGDSIESRFRDFFDRKDQYTPNSSVAEVVGFASREQFEAGRTTAPLAPTVGGRGIPLAPDAPDGPALTSAEVAALASRVVETTPEIETTPEVAPPVTPEVAPVVETTPDSSVQADAATPTTPPRGAETRPVTRPTGPPSRLGLANAPLSERGDVQDRVNEFVKSIPERFPLQVAKSANLLVNAAKGAKLHSVMDRIEKAAVATETRLSKGGKPKVKKVKKVKETPITEADWVKRAAEARKYLAKTQGMTQAERLAEVSRSVHADVDPAIKAKRAKEDLFSKRGKKASDDLSFSHRNGWLMPDGGFHDTPTTGAIVTGGNGLVGDLGEHAQFALSYLDKHDKKAADKFWREKEATLAEDDFDGEITDSEVYDFMHKLGWVRVVGGSDTVMIDGRPSARQKQVLKDSAITYGKQLVQDFGGDRSRTIYDPGDLFSKRGDKSYREATEAGNTAEQIRIVEGFADRTPYKEPGFHYTDSPEFRAFDNSRSRGLHYFTQDEDYARNFGETPIKVRLDPGNVLDAREFEEDPNLTPGQVRAFLEESGVELSLELQAAFREWEQRTMNWGPFWGYLRGMSDSGLADSLREAGYDSVRQYESVYDGEPTEVIAVLSGRQVKSIEAETYDLDGKIIPPSQRFDENTEDYHFSKRGAADTRVSSVDQSLKLGHVTVRDGAGLPTAPPSGVAFSKSTSPDDRTRILDGSHDTDFNRFLKQPSADHYAGQLRNWKIMKGFEGGTNLEVLTEFIFRVKRNLLALHDAMPPELRKRARLWYDGANRIAHDFSKRYNLTVEQAAAVIATLSPQKDWFMNVSLAGRVIDIVRGHQNTVFSPEMGAHFSSLAKSWTPDKKAKVRLNTPRKISEEKAKRNREAQVIREELVGKKLSELKGVDRAVFVRMYDEVNNPTGFAIISPEGDRLGPKLNQTGIPAKRGWGSYAEIHKGIQAVDGDMPTLSEALGNEHKVRNFYNNIVQPSHGLHVTMDTHAVGAGLYLPMSGKSGEVKNNFGQSQGEFLNSSAGATREGQRGLYAVFAEAYRQAAAEADGGPIKTREMQSITWEAIRMLIPDSRKTAQDLAESRGIWEDAPDAESARKNIVEQFGGFGRPDWADPVVGDVRAGNPSTTERPSTVPDGGRDSGPRSGRDTGRGNAGTASPGGVAGRSEPPAFEFSGSESRPSSVNPETDALLSAVDRFYREAHLSTRGSKVKPPKPKVAIERQFAARAAEAIPDPLKPMVEGNREIREKDEVLDLESIKDEAALLSNDALWESVKALEGKVDDKVRNDQVLKSFELLNRMMADKDLPNTEKVFEVLAKAGTHAGQMLRQFREFKGANTAANMLRLIEMSLARANRKLTPAQRANLQKLLKADVDSRDQREAAVDAWLDDPANRKLRKEALDRAAAEKQTYRVLRANVQNILPRTFGQMPADILAAIQGNLMTPVSTGRNFVGNYMNGVWRFPGRYPAAAIDLATHWLTGSERTVTFPSFRGIGWFVKGSYRGIKPAFQSLTTGPVSDNIIGEKIRGFNPVRSFVSAWMGDIPVDIVTGKVPFGDRVKKMTEAVFGAAPEAMLRSLSAMDELAKDGIRAARVAEETKRRGVKPDTKEFAEIELAGILPHRKGSRYQGDREAADAAERSALAATYQNSSEVGKAALAVEQRLSQIPVFGPAVRVGYRVAVSPFILTPANLMMEGMKFAVPIFGFSHAAVKATQAAKASGTERKALHREANLSAGYALVGMTMHALSDILIEEDLVSAGPDGAKENKMRSGSGMGYFRINLSGLRRVVSGESHPPQSPDRPTDWGDSKSHRVGDHTVRLDMFGVLGYVLAVKAEAKRFDERDLTRAPTMSEGATQAFGALMGAGKFALNQTMLQGVAGWLQALLSSDEGAVTKLLAEKVKLATHVAMPNTLVAWNNAHLEHKQELVDRKDKVASVNNVFAAQKDVLANILTQNYSELDGLPNKLDIWGRPIDSTPEGQNPYVYHMLDISKRETVKDDAGSTLFRLHRATRNDDVIPSVVQQTLTHNTTRVNLPPNLFASRVKKVQGAKLEAFKFVLADAAWNRALKTHPDAAAKILKRIYGRFADVADKQWRHANRVELTRLVNELNAASVPR